MWRGEYDTLVVEWNAGLDEAMEGVKTIRVHYVEGISTDDEFQTPAMRLLLMGLGECRKEIEALPSPNTRRGGAPRTR
jgi:hypothetical protein